jgi:hypothetical protein
MAQQAFLIALQRCCLLQWRCTAQARLAQTNWQLICELHWQRLPYQTAQAFATRYSETHKLQKYHSTPPAAVVEYPKVWPALPPASLTQLPHPARRGAPRQQQVQLLVAGWLFAELKSVVDAEEAAPRMA